MSVARFWTITNPEILITRGGGGGSGKDKTKGGRGGGGGGGWTGRGGKGWGKGGGGDPPVDPAFPIVIGIASGNSGTSNITSHPVTVPAHSNGDGLIVILQTNGQVDAGPTNPPGFGDPVWLDITSMANPAWRTMLYCWFKTSDGTQGDFNITTSESDVSLTACIAVRDFQGVPIISNISLQDTSNPNPPNLITGFGAVKTLFFAIAGHSSNVGQNFEGVYPSGWVDNRNRNGNGSSCQYAMCTKEFEAASADPAAYGSWGFARERYTYTMALRGIGT